ncbi:MAG: exostosin family protein [Candidatus Kaiserbacteria bacterium]|nr:MAG: exostosin family protein [Candidatus Kaiserbacteria bacterium]
MPKPVRLYVNKSLVQGDIRYIPFLYSFWGMPQRKLEPFVEAMYKSQSVDTSQFEMVEKIADADFVLPPHNYWHLKEKHESVLRSLIGEAHAAKKLLLIDAAGDLERTVHEKDAYILRIGQYRFDVRENEIAMPVFCEDLLARYYKNALELRSWEPIPSVGFAGWSEMSTYQRLRTGIRKLPYSIATLFDRRYGAYTKGVFLRQKAVQVLRRSRLVKANIISRGSYSGSTVTMEKDPETLRREFVENLASSDYALDIRGDANASTRFYEAISLGRVPLFIDTARVMPLEDVIDYRAFCVVVDHTDLQNLDRILLDFHRSLTPEKFADMQRKARSAYKDHLRMDAFSRHLADRLAKIAREHYGTV